MKITLRIKINNGWYFIQYKGWLFWHDLRDPISNDTIAFRTLKEADKFIDDYPTWILARDFEGETIRNTNNYISRPRTIDLSHYDEIGRLTIAESSNSAGNLSLTDVSKEKVTHSTA